MARPTAEQIFRMFVRAPATVKANSGPNQFAGLTTIVSGTATGVVSTTAVDSDSLVFFGARANLATNVASGAIKVFEVKSINPGNAFTFGTQDGQALGRDTVIHWMIWRTT